MFLLKLNLSSITNPMNFYLLTSIYIKTLVPQFEVWHFYQSNHPNLAPSYSSSLDSLSKSPLTTVLLQYCYSTTLVSHPDWPACMLHFDQPPISSFLKKWLFASFFMHFLCILWVPEEGIMSVWMVYVIPKESPSSFN